MRYYSGLKSNELSNHEKTWKNLKCLLLSERSQAKKATYCMTPTFWKRQNYGDSKKISGCQGCGEDGRGGMTMQRVEDF